MEHPQVGPVHNICNILSVTVVATCLLLKVPQMISIIKAKSTKSLSLTSVLLEECAYSVILTYNYAMGYPLPTYFEYTFLVLQDLVLLVLMCHFNNLLSIKTIGYFILYFVFYNCVAFRIFPDLIITTLMTCVTPLTFFSKGTQLLTLYRSKNPGQLSILTWMIAAYGSGVRILTNFVQTGDAAVIVNNVVSCSMNIAMILAIAYYRKSLKHKLH